MKILHIVEFGKHANGIGTVVERLQKEQIFLGHDVRIITIAENIAYRHLNLVTCRTGKELHSYIESWWPDAVIFHSIWAMPYIYFAKVLLKCNIPYAIMMHGADSKVNRQSAPFKKWFANKLWFNNFMKKASAIIYLSKTEMLNCLSLKNNKNNYIIPNGCDKGVFDINDKHIKKPINIIFLGRLAKFHKGIDVLLDALDILKKRNYKEVRINFYANENDIDMLYLKNRLIKLKDIATYCGGVYGEKKISVLKNADAFILTSRFEGMPMGILEALSFGVPCIVTSGTNMADDIESAGAGWRVELTPNSIADGIIKAVSCLKNDYNKYHFAAQQLSSNFDWKKIAEKHIEMMEKILKSIPQ